MTATYPPATPTAGAVVAPVLGGSGELHIPHGLAERDQGRERLTPELIDLTRDILTEQVWDVIIDVHRRFSDRIPRRTEQIYLDPPPAPPGNIRSGRWQVAAPAKGLTRRHVEICLPASYDSAGLAIESGADVWVADLEDSMSPTWENILRGQAAMAHYARGYRSSHPTMIMRPRGLHLVEPRIEVDGQPVPASIVDTVIFFHHSARTLVDRGVGPYLYLPKLETPQQARWWNELLAHLEDGYAIPRGSARAAVLVETLPGALAMEEILYELRHHAAGLTAGRWDYLNSMLGALQGEDFTLPDSTAITMTTPFMKAFSSQIIDVAHRRGTHAIGSLCGHTTSRTGPGDTRTRGKVAAEKHFEATHGFDGSWVSCPSVVAPARQPFLEVLGGKDHQLTRPTRRRKDWDELHREMTDFSKLSSSATFEGLRTNVSMALTYISSWLEGEGNVNIDGVLEDASAAEIARAQVWQWIHIGQVLDEGIVVSPSLVQRIISAEVESQYGPTSRIVDAARIFTGGITGPLDGYLMARAYTQHMR